MSKLDKLRDKKFQGTLISIGFVCVLLYEGISIMFYLSVTNGVFNAVQILGLPSSMICFIAIPLLFVAWKISNGAKITVPSDIMAKPKQKQQPQQQTTIGTWVCSCGNLAMGNNCNNCGRTRP
jgi:hypothetical protein